MGNSVICLIFSLDPFIFPVGHTACDSKSVLYFCVYVFGRLRDLHYIFAVTPWSSSSILQNIYPCNPTWINYERLREFDEGQRVRG